MILPLLTCVHAHTYSLSSSLQVEDTPFSLCVVIPIDSVFLELPDLSSTFPSPERDVYHRIDVTNISQSLDLCQYMSHNAVMSKQSHTLQLFLLYTLKVSM